MTTFKTFERRGLQQPGAVAGLPLMALAQTINGAPYDKTQTPQAKQAQGQSLQQAPPSHCWHRECAGPRADSAK